MGNLAGVARIFLMAVRRACREACGRFLGGHSDAALRAA